MVLAIRLSSRKRLASTRRRPYKTKETAGFDKKAAELSTDIEGVKSEFDAVNEYLAFVEKECTHKVESYVERKACREVEIHSRFGHH